MKQMSYYVLLIAGLAGGCAQLPPVVHVVPATNDAGPVVDFRDLKLPSAVNPDAGYTGEKVKSLRAVVYWNTPARSTGTPWSDTARMETLFYGNVLSNQTEQTVSPADLSGGMVQILSFSKQMPASDRAGQTALLVELKKRGFDLIDPGVFSEQRGTLQPAGLSGLADVAVEICKMPGGDFFGRVVRLTDGSVLAVSYPQSQEIPGSPSRRSVQNDDMRIKKLCDDLTGQVITQLKEQK